MTRDEFAKMLEDLPIADLRAVGAQLLDRGQLEAADAAYRTLERKADKQGDAAALGWALKSLAQIHRQRGETDYALDYATRALPYAVRTNDRNLEIATVNE